jgi:hypothetical protein
MKSYFFYDAETGEQISKFVLPRNQTVAENCTIHNYNMIPLKTKNGKPRYVLVAGNYQAGISQEGRPFRRSSAAGMRTRRSPRAQACLPGAGFSFPVCGIMALSTLSARA